MTKYNIECLNRAKELIDKDPSRHYTIQEMARLIGFSPSKLKTGFKQLFGMGLYKYLHEQRMQKGKYLLENTDKTLRDISHTLGYKYSNNFSTSFRKQYNKSPTEFRNNPDL
jgi:AraC-like DNA-binding protein